jgi:hypothetical protein
MASTLAKRLGIRDGMVLYAINPPRDYRALLGQPLRFAARPPKGGADFVHLFAETLAALDRDLPRAAKVMRPDGMIWVSRYKKASGIATDVEENLIRERAWKLGLKDMQVRAVGELWSAIKLVNAAASASPRLRARRTAPRP